MEKKKKEKEVEQNKLTCCNMYVYIKSLSPPLFLYSFVTLGFSFRFVQTQALSLSFETEFNPNFTNLYRNFTDSVHNYIGYSFCFLLNSQISPIPNLNSTPKLEQLAEEEEP